MLAGDTVGEGFEQIGEISDRVLASRDRGASVIGGPLAASRRCASDRRGRGCGRGSAPGWPPNDPGPPPADYRRADRGPGALAGALARGRVRRPVLAVERFGGGGLDLRAEAVFAEELAASSEMPELINRIGVYMMRADDDGLRRRGARPSATCRRCSTRASSGARASPSPSAGSDLRGRPDSRSRRRRADPRSAARRSGPRAPASRAGAPAWSEPSPASERHRGLSMVIVDMADPGVDGRRAAADPGRAATSTRSSSTTSRSPVEDVIGEPRQGWKVAMQMLSYERGLFVLERQIRLRRALDELVDRLRGRWPGGERERAAAGRPALRRPRAAAGAGLPDPRRAGRGQRCHRARRRSTSFFYRASTRRLFAAAVELLGPTSRWR